MVMVMIMIFFMLMMRKSGDSGGDIGDFGGGDGCGCLLVLMALV